MAATRAKSEIVTDLAEGLRYYLHGVYKKFSEDEVLFLSSGLAFDVLLCLLPLVLLLTSAVGVFLSSSDMALQRLDFLLDTIFPVGPYSLQIRETIKHVVSDIIAYRTSVGLVGIAVLIWTTTWLLGGIRSVLHRVYKTNDTGNLLIGTLRDVLTVIMISVLFVATSSLTWL
ncbi:MAG TPA: YhjD/YihY/BrkB family envelope integrity protein, partial [Bacteroidota bacterium]